MANVATARAEVGATRRTAEATIAAKDALVEELKALLAEARRPWWRRWRGQPAGRPARGAALPAPRHPPGSRPRGVPRPAPGRGVPSSPSLAPRRSGRGARHNVVHRGALPRPGPPRVASACPRAAVAGLRARLTRKGATRSKEPPEPGQAFTPRRLALPGRRGAPPPGGTPAQARACSAARAGSRPRTDRGPSRAERRGRWGSSPFAARLAPGSPSAWMAVTVQS